MARGIAKKSTGIYNLDMIRKELEMSVRDFCSDMDISTNTYRRYLLEQELSEKYVNSINDYIESLVDDPESYLLQYYPYTPNDPRGRRYGSKNKNGRVKQIPVEEYKEELENKESPYKSRNSVKQYISGEDILIALKNGETVYQEGTQDKFELISEECFYVIAKSRGDKILFFNPAMDLEATYYTVHKEPLKLEVGKKYINKTGQIVTIFAKTTSNEYKGIITGEAQVYTYNKEGEFQDISPNASQKNLVEELA